VIHIDGSKSDPEGRGTEIPVPNGRELQPVSALKVWLEAAGITEGPIFREVDRHDRVGHQALSGCSVARIVKRAIAGAGLDPKSFSGHSMRAGFVTSSLERGVDALKVMKITPAFEGRHAEDLRSARDRFRGSCRRGFSLTPPV
jgi:hypothetical protein